MREIRFRGMSKKGWFYGCPVKDKDGEMLFFTGEYFLGGHYVQYESIEVDINTIGQYTGLKDKNGVEIYEGDVLFFKGDNKVFIDSGKENFNPWWHKDVISFERGCFTSSTISQCNYFFGDLPEIPTNIFHKDLSKGEIIGNIHENPELLK